MDPAGRQRPALALLLVTLTGLLAFVGRALLVGQDANWDLQNYHDYAAYAVLHGRYGLDVGAGGFQGYFNPLPYLVPYELRHRLPPMPAAIVLAALQSAIVPVTWILSGQLLPRSLRLRGLAMVAGLASATVLSEIGTSFADLPLAIFGLGALACLLASGERGGRDRTLLLLAAGALAGAGTGLKLTGAIGVVGLLAAATIPVRPWNGMARRLLRVGAGLAPGFLATGGAWAVFLAQRYGNPIFPSYNSLFRSRSADFVNFSDPRFVPHGLGQTLSYPFLIALGAHPSAENPFADPRFALLLIVCVPLLATTARRGRDPDRRFARSLLFVLVALLVWLRLFAIERYAASLEIVAGLLLIAVLPRLLPLRLVLPGAVLMLALTLADTRPPDWWHRPWSQSWAVTLPPPLHQPAAYILVAHPLGYWASMLPPGARFYTALGATMGLATGGVLGAQLQDGLLHPPGGRVRTLGDDVPMGDAARAGLSALGFVPAAPCLRMPSLWWVDTIVCHADRVGPRPRAAADLAADQPVDVTVRGSGWIYLGDGWANAGPTGTPMVLRTAGLVLHLPAADRPRMLELGFRQPAGSPDRHLVASGAGVAGAGWTLPGSGAPVLRIVCLQAPARASGRVLSLNLRDDSTAAFGYAAAPVLASLRLRDPGPTDCTGPSGDGDPPRGQTARQAPAE